MLTDHILHPSNQPTLEAGDHVRLPSGRTGEVVIAPGNEVCPNHVLIALNESRDGWPESCWFLSWLCVKEG